MLTTTVWRAVVLLLGLATAAHAQSASVRIVALGASNTEGFGVSTWEAYPARLQELLKARGIDAEVVNAGLSGDTTAGMLARLDAFLLVGTHLLILQPGGNDARHAISPAETAGNIARIKQLLDEGGIKLIVTDAALFRSVPDTEMQSDGIHYTPNGYAILAERLLPRVLAALGR
ncbi:MAG: GDSL-type esterase/lipase family protein [Hyphomicrobiaceae bacterium]|jgi:acyl-CoA thioesterase I